MLKKLKRQFVLINMAMVSIVVIAVLSTIGVISYQQSTDIVFDAMNQAVNSASKTGQISNKGEMFQPFDSNLDNNFPFPSLPEDATDSTDDGSDDTQSNPLIGGNSDNVTPVAVYRVTSIGTVQIVSRYSSAGLSDDVLEQAASRLENLPDGRGTLGDLGLFYVKQARNGTTVYAFASTASATSWQELLLMLILIGAGTLLVFFAISIGLSRWVIKPVEEAWTKQKQFLADASHELKTPLTVILANTDIMLKHPERTIASQGQWLESTQQEALDMQDLVVSMLDLAKLDAEKGSGEVGGTEPREDINLSDVAFGTLLQFESIAFEKEVLFEEDVKENLHIVGAPQQISRLCATLLDNACKYAPAGTTVNAQVKKADAAAYRNLPPTTVVQGTLPKGPVAALSVTNQGAPVPPEDLPHVFDRFYRSDKARTHEGGNNSYGLGLAIAAGTVTSHNGCIMVASNAETGTTFTVLLPLVSR